MKVLSIEEHKLAIAYFMSLVSCKTLRARVGSLLLCWLVSHEIGSPLSTKYPSSYANYCGTSKGLTKFSECPGGTILDFVERP